MQQFQQKKHHPERFTISESAPAATQNLNSGTQIAQCWRAPKNQSFTAGITGGPKANKSPARANKEVKVHET